MRVLSLFDGMSCGRLALQKLGVNVESYHASEIDKYAIQVAKDNWDDIIHIGDVTKVDGTQYEGIDLLLGGSPCQGFSFAGKQLNFDDPRSKLFFEYVRILREAKPKYFLLENVKMKKEFQDVISEQLGVQPIEIDSALVSAQRRKRLYWTNIPNVTQPDDSGILLKDIVHENADKQALSTGEIGYMLRGSGNWGNKGNRFEHYLNYGEKKHATLTAVFNKGVPYNAYFEPLAEYIVPFDKTLEILDKEVQRGKVGYFRKDSQANRVYYIHDKAVTLTGDSGGGAAKMGQYLFGCITPDRVEKRQNGQRFSDGMKFYTLTAQDRHGVLVEGYIRKLTPVECERLQTVPDGYTSSVSNTQRYKMLGNGWTIDVIAHILKNIPNENINH